MDRPNTHTLVFTINLKYDLVAFTPCTANNVNDNDIKKKNSPSTTLNITDNLLRSFFPRKIYKF